jgi:hypothetical protein
MSGCDAGDDELRLASFVDADTLAAVKAGASSALPRNVNGVAGLPIVAEVTGAFGVLDGRFGAAAAWVKDDTGWQLAEHGRPFAVRGRRVEVFPASFDQTSRVRLWWTARPVALPAVRTRVVDATLAASAEPGVNGLAVHVRKTDGGAGLTWNVCAAIGTNWYLDELVFAPVVNGSKASVWKQLASGVLVTADPERIVTTEPTREAVVVLRLDAAATLRAVGGL